MKMSKLSTALLAGGLLVAGVSASAEEAAAPITTTGSVAFTTDYLFRGISQTDNNAAVQGSLTFAHSSGLYFTAWGSSIGFTNNGLELDTLLGYSGKAGDVGYDVGVMRYNYPSANNTVPGSLEPDYNEFYASVSYAGAKVGLAYSPEYTFESDEFMYVYVDYGTEVSGFGLAAHVGYNKFDSDLMAAQSVGLLNGDDYLDYKVAVNKAMAGATFELAYIGSDIDEADCGVVFGDNSCEGRVVGTVSKTF